MNHTVRRSLRLHTVAQPCPLRFTHRGPLFGQGRTAMCGHSPGTCCSGSFPIWLAGSSLRAGLKLSPFCVSRLTHAWWKMPHVNTDSSVFSCWVSKDARMKTDYLLCWILSFIHHFNHTHCVLFKRFLGILKTLKKVLVGHDNTLELAIYLFMLILLISKNNEELCN